MDPAGETDGLARKGAQTIGRLAQTARRLAGGLLVGAASVCGSAWLLGVVATSGALRTLWAVAGGLLAAVAVGAAFWSYWSLGLVIERASAIRRSFGDLVSQVSETDLAHLVSRADDEGLGLIRRARLVGRLRSAVTSTAGDFQELSLALAALARFPATALLAVGSILVFGVFGFVFLVVIMV